MPILGEPREIYNAYVAKCAYCEYFPLRSLIVKGAPARFDDPERAENILEEILDGGDVSSGKLRWLSRNWPGAGEAAQEWYQFFRANGKAKTPERGNVA